MSVGPVQFPVEHGMPALSVMDSTRTDAHLPLVDVIAALLRKQYEYKI